MIDSADSRKFTCQSHAGLIPKFLISCKIKGMEFHLIFSNRRALWIKCVRVEKFH